MLNSSNVLHVFSAHFLSWFMKHHIPRNSSILYIMVYSASLNKNMMIVSSDLNVCTVTKLFLAKCHHTVYNLDNLNQLVFVRNNCHTLHLLIFTHIYCKQLKLALIRRHYLFWITLIFTKYQRHIIHKPEYHHDDYQLQWNYNSTLGMGDKCASLSHNMQVTLFLYKQTDAGSSSET
jgi:hypothetical protein